MPEFNQTHSWPRWHGHLDEILEACLAVSRAFSDWTKTDTTVHVEARFKGGFSQEFDGLEGFKDFTDRDLTRIEELRLRLGSGPWFEGSPRCLIVADSGIVAMFYSISAGDRHRVEGLALRVDDILRPGAQFPPLPSWLIGILVFLVLLVAYPFTVDATFSVLWTLKLAAQNGKYDPAEIAMFPIVAAAFVGVLVAVVWLSADLVILPARGQRRTRRFIALAGGVVAAVVTSIIGSFIYSLFVH